MVVPGEVLFVDQRPHQAQPSRKEAQQARYLSKCPLVAIRGAAIEIDSTQSRKAHTRSLTVTEHEQESIKNPQQCSNGNQKRGVLFGQHEHAAGEEKNSQEQS